MADEFTIDQIRDNVAERIAIIEFARQRHGNPQFMGGYKDAAMMQWLLDRLEKAEAERDALQARVEKLEGPFVSLVGNAQVLAKCAGDVDHFMKNARLVDALNNVARAIRLARAALAKEPKQ